MSLQRSAGYSLFIALQKFLFGSWVIEAVIATQFLLIVGAGFFFSNHLKSILNFNRWQTFFVFVILLIPCFYEIRSVNSILSEGLAYPLYLFILGNLLKSLVDKNLRFFYHSLLLLLLLILIRNQFVFVILVMLLIAAFTFDKKAIPILLTLFLLPVSILIDMAYHKTVNGYFVTTPWTGVQTAALPFYVSGKNDAEIFQNENDRAYFEFIRKRLAEKKLLLENVPADSNPTDFYFDSYINISIATIYLEGQEFNTKDLSTDEKLIRNDEINKRMTIQLIRENFAKWFTVYFKNFTNGLGSAKIMIVHLLIVILSALAFWKSRYDVVAKTFLVWGLLTFANSALVAIAEPTTSRYMFYHNWILITIVYFLLSRQFGSGEHIPD